MPNFIYNSIYYPSKICSGATCNNRILVETNLENIRESMKLIKSILSKSNDHEIKVSVSNFQEELRKYRREIIDITE